LPPTRQARERTIAMGDKSPKNTQKTNKQKAQAKTGAKPVAK
jgi:hypothetical protein